MNQTLLIYYGHIYSALFSGELPLQCCQIEKYFALGRGNTLGEWYIYLTVWQMGQGPVCISRFMLCICLRCCIEYQTLNFKDTQPTHQIKHLRSNLNKQNVVKYCCTFSFMTKISLNIVLSKCASFQ